MIIGFFGVAGVGKTTLSLRVEKMLPGIKAYSASQLIRNFNGEINYNKLSNNNINSNQLKLIKCANDLKSEFPFSSFILELHNVIEMESGDVFIPKTVFDQIGVDKAFFIYKNPHDIYRQRSSDYKKRSMKNANEIGVLQEQALIYFENIFPGEKGIKLNIDDFLPDEALEVVCRDIRGFLAM